MLVIADSHIQEGTPGETDFWKMLRRISAGRQDVCFLGDILELWVSLPGYETAMQRRFLEWCEEESKRRKVYFVEGNHEFCVFRRNRQCFTDGGEDTLVLNGIMLLHGDLIQPAGSSHYLFRKLTKSRLMSMFVRILPGGRWLVAKVKKLMEARAKHRKFFFPRERIDAWCNSQATEGVRSLVMGHFHHRAVSMKDGEKPWTVIPDWKKRRQVAKLDLQTGKLKIIPWQEI
jgi:UDP-2,3-diacylglucosamine pyrophosphatase LpxH